MAKKKTGFAAIADGGTTDDPIPALEVLGPGPQYEAFVERVARLAEIKAALADLRKAEDKLVGEVKAELADFGELFLELPSGITLRTTCVRRFSITAEGLLRAGVDPEQIKAATTETKSMQLNIGRRG